jgi:regulator of protease activity HflC (stomatin/prohibitin superfamily)
MTSTALESLEYVPLIIIGIAILLALSGIKVINQGNEALVEKLGKYNGKKLKPGLNYVIPFLERISFYQTIRERVIDIPPQQCITRDNVTISADAVVYWKILDMERAYYKVESLQLAMVNLVLTQIRSEIGKLELDETFTARTQINEILLRELDEATDPWGVKVTRVELRDIVPARAVLDAMEMQMSAERKKRAAILTSEGEREAAINSARGQAEAQILNAEAKQRSVLLAAEADRQQQILRAQGIAASTKALSDCLQENAEAHKAVEVLFALGYLDMGTEIGRSDSAKVLFLDPRTVPAALEGIKTVIGNLPDSESKA